MCATVQLPLSAALGPDQEDYFHNWNPEALQRFASCVRLLICKGKYVALGFVRRKPCTATVSDQNMVFHQVILSYTNWESVKTLSK